ncbi:MAG: hypothetical protein ACLRMZ_14585 [Blautia marasmi]
MLHGRIFFKRSGCAREHAAGIPAFEKAANANIPAAQYNLSILYRYGEGVEKDEAKADLWLAKAAQNGFKLAKDALNGQQE